jgi:hypothetical protein
MDRLVKAQGLVPTDSSAVRDGDDVVRREAYAAPRMATHGETPCLEGNGEETIQMAKISVEVRSGTARFAVGVQAPPVQQALIIVATRFPGNVIRMKSPIDHEGSSVEDLAA